MFALKFQNVCQCAKIQKILPQPNDSDEIIETVKDGIQVIKLNRPKKKNAINDVMYKKIIELLTKATGDPGIKITVLTGTGDFFSSGNDFRSSTKQMIEGGPTKAKELIMQYRNLITAIIDFPKLLIAVVNGPAIGVAFTMLALFDLVYCSHKTYFLAPFSNLGITPEGCSTFTFPRIFGTSKTNEILLCGQKLSAEDAVRFGFVSAILNDQKLAEICDEFKEFNVNDMTITEGKTLLKDKKLLHEINEKESDVLFKIYLNTQSSL